MSYNTRRGHNTSYANSATSVGQRRPVVTNNFVSGGQLTQNKPNVQQNPQQASTPQQAQRTPQQASTPQQAQRTPQQQARPTPQQTPQANAAPAVQFRNQQQAQQTQVKQQIQQQQQAAAVAQVQANPPVAATPKVETEAMEIDGDKKKKPWMKLPNLLTAKISKRERQRRRNVRLSKILQPKNALMILNELVKSPTYTVSDIPCMDGNMYSATVLIEDIEHRGTGRSKIQAKSSAAESAIKYLVKHKQISSIKPEEDLNNGAESMEVTEQDVNAPLPWQHVASLALFKLFCSWGEDPNKARQETERIQAETKPAKKLPENSLEMNPLMLLNQMQPHTQFEEVAKTGNPPNVRFTFKCNVNGQEFIGTGTSKKLAKKNAAFAACNKVYGIIYPQEVYTPQ